MLHRRSVSAPCQTLLVDANPEEGQGQGFADPNQTQWDGSQDWLRSVGCGSTSPSLRLLEHPFENVDGGRCSWDGFRKDLRWIQSRLKQRDPGSSQPDPLDKRLMQQLAKYPQWTGEKEAGDEALDEDGGKHGKSTWSGRDAVLNQAKKRVKESSKNSPTASAGETDRYEKEQLLQAAKLWQDKYSRLLEEHQAEIQSLRREQEAIQERRREDRLLMESKLESVTKECQAQTSLRMQLEEKGTEADHRIADLNRELSQTRASLKEARSEISSVLKHHERLDREKRDIQDRYEEAMRELDRAQQQKQKAQEQVARKERELRQVEGEVSHYKQKLFADPVNPLAPGQAVGKDGKDQEDIHQSCREKLRSMIEKNITYRQEADEARQQNEKLQDDLKTAHAEFKAAQDTISMLKQQLAQSKQQLAKELETLNGKSAKQQSALIAAQLGELEKLETEARRSIDLHQGALRNAIQTLGATERIFLQGAPTNGLHTGAAPPKAFSAGSGNALGPTTSKEKEKEKPSNPTTAAKGKKEKASS
jgi:hypothetical protein